MSLGHGLSWGRTGNTWQRSNGRRRARALRAAAGRIAAFDSLEQRVMLSSVAISAATVTEGNSGTTDAVFNVTLSAASETDVFVDYTTADSADAQKAAVGVDYVATSGRLIIPAGQTQGQIRVAVNGDTAVEPDETFAVQLTHVEGADLVNSVAVGTILHDDLPTVSIQDIQKIEGNSGQTEMMVLVQLSDPAPRNVSVQFATAAGTATPSVGTTLGDYTSSAGTLQITQGFTTGNFAIILVGDTAIEPDETFTINLSEPNGMLPGRMTATATILNDDQPTVTVSPARVVEGNDGTKNLSFAVNLSVAGLHDVTFQWATQDGTATAGADYTESGGTVTIPAGQTQATITVPVLADAQLEPDETLRLNLSGLVGGVFASSQVTGTIEEDDFPTLTISAPTIVENHTGTADAVFTVNLSAPAAQNMTVRYATADLTAKAGEDYTSTAGTLTILAGQSSGTIAVPIRGDTTFEADETFKLQLDNASKVVLGTSSATATIPNDDLGLTVGDVTLSEANSGTRPFAFTINLSAASATAVTAHWATANGTATAGTDYTAASGDLTFAPGETTKTVTVNVLGDGAFEANETFSVVLSNAVGADLAKGTGTGTISNDDAGIYVSDVSVVEGDSGTKNVQFTVTVNPAAAGAVSVQYRTVDGSAKAGQDYDAASGTLNFAAGVTSKVVNVVVRGDTTPEANETFTLALSNANGAGIGDASAVATITNDDLPQLSIGNVTLVEGNSGETNAQFYVQLSAAAAPIVVHYSTADGTAKASESDYTAASDGVLNIPAGATYGIITIPVKGDTIIEGDETFTLTLTSAEGATIGAATGTATIQNDDKPTLSIAAASVSEGASGTTNLDFTVTLSAAFPQPVTVSYSAVSGSATLGSDFNLSPGTLTFAPNELTKTIRVAVVGDTAWEANETFTIVLSNPVNAALSTASGGDRATGTINNDDLPTISVRDVTVTEGDSGEATATVTVVLQAASSSPVTVHYRTADDTATVADNDYTAVADTVLTIDAGQTSKTFTLKIKGDGKVEPNEAFKVILSDATNATIDDGTGVVTITNDDPNVTIADTTLSEGQSGTADAVFTVTLSQAMTNDVVVRYSTRNGSAVGGTGGSSDFETRSGSLTIPAGQTTGTIRVPVYGDTTAEANENFSVYLDSATSNNAAVFVKDASGLCTINNDDLPTINFSNAVISVSESAAYATFTLNVSGVVNSEITLDYTTVDGTATVAGNDYTATSGTLHIAANQTSGTISVPIKTDSTKEENETFTILLSNANGVTLVATTATATILNDDPSLSISGASANEGNTAANRGRITFTISLSAATTEDITVHYATVDSTAKAGTDYDAKQGVATILAGQTTTTFEVMLIGDTTYESNEYFTVSLSDASGGTYISTASATGTITNDDSSFSISDASTSAVEGQPVSFTITRSGPADAEVTLDYSIASGTAIRGADLPATTGTVTFAVNETTKTISIPTTDDAIDEGDNSSDTVAETFTVNLTSATGATITRAAATGKIRDNDTAPGVTMRDIQVPEGQWGMTDAKFTLVLSAPSSQTVVVNYTTALGEDAELNDLKLVNGSVSFAPGQTTRTVIVPVYGDRERGEGNEHFYLRLTNATNASIGNNQAVGTILDDETVAAAPEIRVFWLKGTRSGELQTAKGLIDFGSVRRGATAPIRAFRVVNSGNWPLTIKGLRLPAGYAVVEGLSKSIAPGKSDTFRVKLLTSKAGKFAGNIRILSTDSSEATFSIPVTGTVKTTAALRARTAAAATAGPAVFPAKATAFATAKRISSLEELFA